MRVTGINGLTSRLAEISRLWRDYDKLWERTDSRSATPAPDKAAPQAQPQRALHNPRKGVAWFLRSGAPWQFAAGARTWRRSLWPSAVDNRSATGNISSLPERTDAVTESDAGAIDIVIRERNQRAAFFHRLARNGILARNGEHAETR